MEIIRNYPELEEILKSIKKIADNLEEMTRIMEIKNPITMTPEKVKQINALYGMSVARPLPDYDPEILRSEIQDLKLENDRLKRRDDIMQHFIKSVHCKKMICENCDLHFLNDKGTDLCAQVDHVRLESIASEILKKLEDL